MTNILAVIGGAYLIWLVVLCLPSTLAEYTDKKEREEHERERRLSRIESEIASLKYSVNKHYGQIEAIVIKLEADKE